MTGPLGVAVVGVGRWGTTLLRVLGQLEGCRVHYIYDGAQEACSLAAETLPSVEVATAFDQVLSSDRVQAVLVATPPESHGVLAKQILEAGKHVFIEKPMATSLADALALERIARKNNCFAMAGHLLRYHAGVAALRHLIVQGKLGHIEWILSRRIGWRAADRCGPWWSLAPHDLSVLRGALGCEPDQIAATPCLPQPSTRNPVLMKVLGARDSQPPPSLRCPQRVVAAASFPGHTSALIDVGLLDESKMRRVILVGRRAMAKFEDGTGGGLWIRPMHEALDLTTLPSPDQPFSVETANHYIDTIESAAKGEGWTALESSWPDALPTELQQFIAGCQNPRLAETEMEDALAIMRALEVGARSMREGGRTLNVPKPARIVPGEFDSSHFAI
jgi:predicted dehydrogenase